MKKFIALVLSFAMVILFVGCGGSSGGSSEEANSKSDWFIPNIVDDFGDTVEDAEQNQLKTISYGDFSNTATSKSDLTVEVTALIATSGLASFAFHLLEYNDTPATYLDSSEITMKIKGADNAVSEFTLHGVAPNSEVFLYGFADRGEDALFNELYSGNDVKCIINIDSSQYNFSISAKGFKELYDSVTGTSEAETVQGEKTTDAASAVNNILTQKDDSEYLLDAYKYLADNRDSYALMTDADIKKELDGDFYYSSLSNKGNTVSTYRYIMNYSGNTRTQKLYYKDGVNTDPEEASMSKEFTYSNGVIEEALSDPCQLRKLSDGYYVAYATDGSDYTIPCWFLMKVHGDGSNYTADYPLPQ